MSFLQHLRACRVIAVSISEPVGLASQVTQPTAQLSSKSQRWEQLQSNVGSSNHQRFARSLEEQRAATKRLQWFLEDLYDSLQNLEIFYDKTVRSLYLQNFKAVKAFFCQKMSSELMQHSWHQEKKGNQRPTTVETRHFKLWSSTKPT